MPVIVKASQAGGATHADYPCLLASSLPAHLWGRVRSDGLDCVLTAADGVTPLYREVATFDVAGERPEIYFRLPSYSHLEDTLVYLYYGNPDYSEPSDVAVWPTDTWAAVYHMNDNPADNTQILDSTANGNTGTKGAGAAAPTEVDGIVGKAQEFVAGTTVVAGDTGDYIEVADDNSLDNTAQTVMIVVTLPPIQTASVAGLVGKRGNNTSEWKMFQYGTTGPVRFIDSYSGDYITAGYALSATSQLAFTSFGTTCTAYKDGVLAETKTTMAGVAGNVYAMRIGAAINRGEGAGAWRYVDGVIDELRLASVARSAEWIAAEDHWLRNNSLCYEVGAYEHRPLYIMQGYRRTTDGASATPQTYRRVSERTEYVAQGYRRLTLPAEYIAQGYRRVVNKALYTIATKRRLRPLYRILGRPSYGMDHHPKPDYGLGPNGRPDDRNL